MIETPTDTPLKLVKLRAYWSPDTEVLDEAFADAEEVEINDD